MQKRIRGLAVTSMVFLIADIFALIRPTLYSIRVGNSAISLYRGFNISMPILTRVAISSYYIFIFAALILIAKELSKKKLINLMINITVLIILVFAIIPFLDYGIFLPMREISAMVK
ncbi:MAG: hypothetical protein PVI33_03525 [Candidatus Omnitrophota bacterium]